MSAAGTAFGERVADHYEAWYKTPQGQRADALEKASLRLLLDGFAGAGSVLEIGAGTGHFTRWLSGQGVAAVGLDLATAMLAQARALDGILLVRGDACSLPFADDAFDLVALITTLEFLEHPQAALAEALRVTRRGLLLGVLNRRSLLGLQRRLAGFLRPTVYDAARFYTVGGLRRLLRSVAGGETTIAWHTTLFPRRWPWPRLALPWGGFIGMALHMPEG
jgi:ubiquinone/menaquinone biosynthesis C-methylase UbiE